MSAANILNGVVTAPLDSRENERLLALRSYCVLDTEPEPAFEDLTAIGSALFRTPIVLISLVEEHRQFFKSVVGLNAREMPRNSSFCAWTILDDAPFVVLDAILDDRFQSNPLVTGSPGIRFYAGAPLIDSHGFRLGSFCVIDTSPHAEFSVTELALLRRLAALTVSLLEQRLFPERIARVEEELVLANERYKLVTQATRDGIWDWNYASGEFFLSAHLQSMLGLPEEDCWGTSEDWYRRMHPQDVCKVREQIERLKDTDTCHFETEFRVRHQDLTWRWFHTKGAVVREAKGQLLRLTGASADVTSERTKDELTSLHTRLSLLTSLAFRRGIADPSAHPFGLLCIDIDHFKRINDSFGRNAGDLLLIEVASRIQRSIASCPTDLAARIVGDEFAVLLGSAVGEHSLLAYASRLHSLLESPLLCGDQMVRLSVSIGIALARTSDVEPEQLLHDADSAMHQAKASGDGKTIIFTSSIREKAFARMSLEVELREALTSNAVSLHYQPKVQLSTGKLVGFEALMRWQHPKLGFIPPDDFIPLAEQSDLILEIGRWTLRQAIRELAGWRARAIVHSDVTVAVNLSARQFGDPELIRNLTRKLSLFELPAQCLALEVTEGILITDLERALEVLKRLKNLGVGLDLDDFGTGYSSLRYLQSFPFDSLKVDKSFIRDLGTGRDAAAITQSIIALGCALGLKIIAEGIETQEQADHLVGMGCSFGQGYLFSKPLPAEAVERYLQGAEAAQGRPKPSFRQSRLK